MLVKLILIGYILVGILVDLEINRSLEVMKEDKRRQLWKIIVEAGDYLRH